MTTIDLRTKHASIEEILQLAESEGLVVRTAEGKVFAISEIESAEAEDADFSQEVALTRRNTALRELLRQRSQEPAALTIDEVRERLGLTAPGGAGERG
jgi:hypothetical protein